MQNFDEDNLLYWRALPQENKDAREAFQAARWDEEADEREEFPVYAAVQPPSSIFTTLRYSEAMMYWEANHKLVRRGQGELLRTRFYMLQYHIDRLRKAAECFNYPTDALDDEDVLARFMVDIALSKISEACEDDITRLHQVAGRVRVTIKPTGEVKVECAIIPLDRVEQEETYFPRSLTKYNYPPKPKYQIYLCPFPTEPSDYTLHKTDCRDMYTAARVACGLPAQPTSDPVEVMLWSPEGRVMEGSLTSVYFWRPDLQGIYRWITPHNQSGGNRGTTRRWAVESGLCIVGSVYVEGRNGDGVDGVKEGEHCWISNGFRGFHLAVVRKCYYDRAMQEKRDNENESIAVMTPTSDQSLISPVSARWESLSSAGGSSPVTR